MSDRDLAASYESVPAADAGAAIPTDLFQDDAPSPSLNSSIVRLAAGRGAATAVTLLSAPIVTRIYDPDTFGALDIVSNCVALLIPCASLAYVAAMPLAKTVSGRRDLFVLSAILSAVPAGLLAVVAVLWGDRLAAAYGKPYLAPYAIAVPLLFAAMAIHQLTNMTLSCDKQFGQVAIRGVVAAVCTRAVQIAAGLTGWDKSAAGLLAGTIVGTFLGGMTLAVRSTKSLFRRSEQAFRFAGVKAAAVDYRKFPLYSLWSALLNTIGLSLPVMVMGLVFLDEIVGYYGMAFRLIVLPVALFADSATQVFFVHAAKTAARGESLTAETQGLFRTLMLLTTFPFAATLVLGPLLFAFALGETWREAGVYAQILVPWFALRSISFPLSRMFLIRDRQGLLFAFNIVQLAARMSALLVGGMFFEPRGAIGLYSAMSTAMVAWLAFRALGMAQTSRWWALGQLARSYGEVTLLLLPAGVLYWGMGMEFTALAALAGASLAYCAVLYRRHPQIHAVAQRVFSRGSRSSGGGRRSR